MESKRRLRFLIAIPTFLVWSTVFIAPLQAFAAEDKDKLEKLRKTAQEHEAKFQWAKACEVYWQILKVDPSLTADRERCQLCFRRAHQHFRHRDRTLLDALAKRKPAQALEAYSDVLTKVREYYLDEEKVDLVALFRQGLRELQFALDDKAFLQEYLDNTKAEKVRAFRTRLQEWPSLPSSARVEDARDQAEQVALAAQEDLGLKAAGVTAVLFEFVCGAVNALDEYTWLLTPSQIRDLQTKPDSMAARTVEDYRMLSETVGYVKLTGFQQGTVQELNTAILQLQTSGMKGLVLDLRGNGGGSFKTAVQVARLFLSEGVIVFTQGRRPEANETFKANNPNALNLPLVVLVDRQTASAAEVLAGALKESHKCVCLVGQNTYGKGLIQQFVPLEKVPAGMWITSASYFSPANHAYHGRGVAPHIVVELDDMDAQLTAARAEMQKLLMMVR